MKNTPASILTALAGDLMEPYLVLDMEFSLGTVSLTNLPYDITIGATTYTSDGGLTKLSPPQLTSVADREIYRIELVDFSNEYKVHFDNNAVGTVVTVRMGIEGNFVDLDIVYKGRIDACQIETNPAEGTKVAIIECSSPFGALDRTTERMSLPKDQKRLDPTDTTFDRVFQDIEVYTLKWGKKR